MIGNTEDIAETLWYDGKSVRSFATTDEGRAFKWLLAEKDGSLMLMAMPDDTPLDFHKELRDAICALKGWRTDDVKILGGGTRLLNGEIIHKSTFFGEMPERHRESVLRKLGL